MGHHDHRNLIIEWTRIDVLDWFHGKHQAKTNKYIYMVKISCIFQVLKEKYGVKCLLGLTATATMKTATSIASHIGIDDQENAIIRGKPMPPNLHLSVSRDENKEQVIL